MLVHQQRIRIVRISSARQQPSITIRKADQQWFLILTEAALILTKFRRRWFLLLLRSATMTCHCTYLLWVDMLVPVPWLYRQYCTVLRIDMYAMYVYTYWLYKGCRISTYTYRQYELEYPYIHTYCRYVVVQFLTNWLFVLHQKRSAFVRNQRSSAFISIHQNLVSASASASARQKRVYCSIFNKLTLRLVYFIMEDNLSRM